MNALSNPTSPTEGDALSASSSAGGAALSIRNLSKTFFGMKALDNVSIDFRRGAVTALLGPNGCGKSTIIKVLAGFHQPDDGAEITLDGSSPLRQPIRPRDVFDRGLRFVHQDLGLVEELSVSDNFSFSNSFDGRFPLSQLRKSERQRRTRISLATLGLDIDPSIQVGRLSRTDQILITIARAFQRDEGDDATTSRKILILDEPTASLPSASVELVLESVRRIKASGGTVIYVTHRLDEVTRIGDDVVILRDGKVIAHQRVEGLSAHELADIAIGIRAERPEREAVTLSDEVVLELSGIRTKRLQGIDLTIRKGEILGVTGLAGCGRSELARIIAGAQSAESGTIALNGKPLGSLTPRASLRVGIAFVPPERIRLGCIPDMSLRHNISLSNLAPFWRGGKIRQTEEKAEVMALLEKFQVNPRDPERRMGNLSGGNQQKAVIAKFARLNPQVLVVDEPTQGVDVVGKEEIARALREMALGGCSILVASSDFDEISDLCDRVLVLDRGSVLGIFDRGTVSEERVSMMGENRKTEENS